MYTQNWIMKVTILFFFENVWSYFAQKYIDCEFHEIFSAIKLHQEMTYKIDFSA